MHALESQSHLAKTNNPKPLDDSQTIYVAIAHCQRAILQEMDTPLASPHILVFYEALRGLLDLAMMYFFSIMISATLIVEAKDIPDFCIYTFFCLFSLSGIPAIYGTASARKQHFHEALDVYSPVCDSPQRDATSHLQTLQYKLSALRSFQDPFFPDVIEGTLFGRRFHSMESQEKTGIPSKPR